MKRYQGQALAVIMIVFVVASILGLSIYSRTIRDTKRIAFEKSSAESYEISESIIESLRGVSITELEEACSDSRFGGDLRSVEGCRVLGIQDVNEFLLSLGVSFNVDNIGKCSTESSTVEILASIATDQDEIEIGEHSSRAYIFKGQTPNPTSCNLNMIFDPKGNNTAGFSVMKKYVSDNTGLLKTYSSYQINDIQQYCVHKQGADCTSNTNLLGTWTPIQSGSILGVSLSPVSGNTMEEVRISSFSGTVGVRTTVEPAQCVRDWEMVKIVVNANCSGANRGVEIQFPQNEWSLPIFDYVIYNGSGALGNN
jgi:hypothetical protein